MTPKSLLFVFSILLLPSSSLAQNVLILEDNQTQDSLYTVLSQVGYDVTLGGPYWLYDGEDLDQYDLLIFLNGVVYSQVMPNEVQQRIRDFVENGGRLFTIEWLLWSGAVNATITSMLPLRYGGTWSAGSETYTKQVEHPIAKDLPETFTLPPSWSFSVSAVDTAASKGAVAIFSGSRSGDAVAASRFGSGAVVHWNMGGEWYGPDIWTPEVKTLTRNIVAYLLDYVPTNDQYESVPGAFALKQNYPNPFNPATTISYSLGNPAFVALRVFDVLGREVATLVNEEKAAGEHAARFDASGLTSGIYLYRLEAGDFTSTRKLLLVE